MDDVVFTIGHSTHTAELHQITAVADVRLQPYSRMNPQFNRETLREMLRESHMAYVFLGKELGARSEDRTCYLDGKAQYGRLSQTELFRRGLDRVREGTRSFRVALMCAEKEPLECHRTILVARHLEPLRIEIRHILADA